MRVTLLRHAQTAGNLLGQYIGSSDLSLCETGHLQAEGVSPRADVRRVYTSSLRRTAQTAQILYPSADIVQCRGLNEMDFGRFEQKSWRDLEHDAAYRAWVDSGCEASCPSGESKAIFTRRCVEAFQSVATTETAGGAAELHCVVHGGTIMAILSELARPVLHYFDWKADFCGGYLLEYSAEHLDGRPLRLVETIRPKEGSEKP